MAIDKRLQIYDEQGNLVDYDILASDVKFLPDGKDLPTKLAEMEQEIEDAGSGDGTVTGVKIGSTTYDPTDGVVDLSSPMSNKVDKNGTDSLMTAAEHTKLGDLPTATELATQMNAKANDNAVVKTISVNGTTQSPVNGNVDIILETAGEDGITPHIDAVTGNWFIGDENTGVPATGPQGNSGVASGDDVVVVNNLNGEPSDLESGQVAVLSAEQGKYLGDRTLIGTGTFGDAYDKATAMNVPFPWLLDDIDDEGNKVKKMMWHAGNGVFIDAIGGEVSGDRNGLTIECLKPCMMKAFNDERTNTLLFSKQLTAGINLYTLDEIADDIQDSAQSNKTLSRLEFYDTEGVELLNDAVKKIDFGGLALNGGGVIISGQPKNLLKDQTELTVVKRMNLVNNDIKGITNILAGCVKLSYLGLSGSILYTGSSTDSFIGFLNGDNVIQTLDLSGLSVESSILNKWFNAGTATAVTKPLQYLDISGIDFSKANNVSDFCYGQTSLATLIVGNFSNANVTSVSGAFVNRSRSGNMHTLVCRCKYPPEMVADASTPSNADASIDFLYRLSYYNPNTFGDGNGVILVPPGSKQYYDVATVWSDYSTIIDEFNEGDYDVIDNTPNP